MHETRRLEHYSTAILTIETHGALNSCTGFLLLSLGERLSAESGDSREASFLFQQNVSVVDLQRFNAGLMRESFLDAKEQLGLQAFQRFSLFMSASNP